MDELKFLIIFLMSYKNELLLLNFIMRDVRELCGK